MSNVRQAGQHLHLSVRSLGRSRRRSEASQLGLASGAKIHEMAKCDGGIHGGCSARRLITGAEGSENQRNRDDDEHPRVDDSDLYVEVRADDPSTAESSRTHNRQAEGPKVRDTASPSNERT